MIEDLIPVEKIDACFEAYLPLLQSVQEREPIGGPTFGGPELGDLAEGKGRLQQLPARYTVSIPWVAPFADPELYENPVRRASRRLPCSPPSVAQPAGPWPCGR